MKKLLESKLQTPIVLIEGDTTPYWNKYVAQPSFKNKKVVAFGKEPLSVLEEAKALGFKDPVIFYFGDIDLTSIRRSF